MTERYCHRCGKALEAVACLCRPPIAQEQRERVKAALASYLARRRPQWLAAPSLPPKREPGSEG